MRVVALIVAISQGAYAVAPAVFGLVRQVGSDQLIFVAASAIQVLAIAAYLLGRRSIQTPGVAIRANQTEFSCDRLTVGQPSAFAARPSSKAVVFLHLLFMWTRCKRLRVLRSEINLLHRR